MIAGTGTVIMNQNNREKDNKAAHIVYEEILDKHKLAFEMGYDSFQDEQNRFWEELTDSVVTKYPNDLLDASQVLDSETPYIRELFYPAIGDNEFEKDIPLPQSVYDPLLDTHFAWFDYCTESFDNEYFMVFDSTIYYGFYDFDDNGVDELIIKTTSNKNRTESAIRVYFILDNHVVYADVEITTGSSEQTWVLMPFGGYEHFCFEGINYCIFINCHPWDYENYSEPQVEFNYLCG
jgi:hypothetical protein